MIYDYFDFVKKSGYFTEKRRQQELYWMYETIDEKLRDSFYHNPAIEEMLAAKRQLVLGNRQSSFIAAHEVLDHYFTLLKQ